MPITLSTALYMYTHNCITVFTAHGDHFSSSYARSPDLVGKVKKQETKWREQTNHPQLHEVAGKGKYLQEGRQWAMAENDKISTKRETTGTNNMWSNTQADHININLRKKQVYIAEAHVRGSKLRSLQFTMYYMYLAKDNRKFDSWQEICQPE